MDLVDDYLTFFNITLQNPIFTDRCNYIADVIIFANLARRIINLQLDNTFALTIPLLKIYVYF
jgi:hypothetical protein